MSTPEIILLILLILFFLALTAVGSGDPTTPLPDPKKESQARTPDISRKK